MRRVLGCFVFIMALAIVIYLAGWWFQSPRRDLWTPARQGDITLRRVYVSGDEGNGGYSLPAPANSIVVEFQPHTSDFSPTSGNVLARIVASDGATIYRDICSVSQFRASERRLWERLTNALGRVAAGSSAPNPVQVEIPIAYSPSTRYLDIYFDTPETAGCRWRLVHLPRADRHVPPNPQPVTAYHRESFDLQARARLHTEKQRHSMGEKDILVTFDATRTSPRTDDYDIFVGVKSVTPQWLSISPTAREASDDYLWAQVLGGGNRSYSFSVRLPFAEHQRYVRVEGETCMVRYRHGQRTLRLSVRRLRLRKGTEILVAVPERGIDVEFPGMFVQVYGAESFPGLLKELHFTPPKDTRGLLFFFCTYPWEEINEFLLLSVSALPTRTGKRLRLHSKEILIKNVLSLAWRLPAGEPTPREIRVRLRSKASIRRDDVHRFQLVLPVEK